MIPNWTYRPRAISNPARATWDRATPADPGPRGRRAAFPRRESEQRHPNNAARGRRPEKETRNWDVGVGFPAGEDGSPALSGRRVLSVLRCLSGDGPGKTRRLWLRREACPGCRPALSGRLEEGGGAGRRARAGGSWYSCLIECDLIAK